MAQTMPEDFAIRYEWVAGTMPPPYHHEYTIQVGPDGQGEITYIRGYSAQEAPVWHEVLDVERKALESLYALMVQKGLFVRTWKPLKRHPVGGSQVRLEVTARGHSYRVHNFLEKAETLEEVFAGVQALVPQTLWDGLYAQRQQYEEECLRQHQSRRVMDIDAIKDQVRAGHFVISAHADQEAADENIDIAEICDALLNGEILETYLDTGRGPSCLFLGFVGDRPIHVVCGWHRAAVVIITVYIPKPPKFTDPRIRRRP